MTSTPAIEVAGLSHSYRGRAALCELSLNVERAEIFAFLGPNGGGKTTLFRVLSTLIPIQAGNVRLLGLDIRTDAFAIRRRLGVVFQAPSLDKKLTVLENIRFQAALYGLTGHELRLRESEVLERLRLTDRANERTETLSGGLRRRVELAKGLIHRPDLMLLDEPSTGLDPGARSDLWAFLQQLRDEFQMTIALTTHLLEEADKADRIAILDAGKRVALGTPNELRGTVGVDSITIQSPESSRLSTAIQERFGIACSVVDGNVRLEQSEGHQWIPKLVEAFPQWISSITLGKPTLEDVFIAKTGHRFMRSRGSGIMSEAVTPRPWLVVFTLGWREIIRFFRQRNRVIGAVGQPILFWLLFGAGLQKSFSLSAAGTSGQSFLEYYFPGSLMLVLMFTAIFATISIIEDRREGFLQSVLVAPVPRWSMVLGKVLGGTAIALFQGLLFLALALTLKIKIDLVSFLQITGLLFLSALALTSLGFVIAWRMESTQGFHAIMNLALMPMWMLSGAFWPIPATTSASSVGEMAMSWSMRLNPLTYCVAGVRHLLNAAPMPADFYEPSLTTCWLVAPLFAMMTFVAAWRIAGQRTTGDLL